MASTPSQTTMAEASQQQLSLEAVAQYLVNNSFLLTGLELLQECAERGRQDIPASLKDTYTPQKLEELLAQEDVAAVVSQARSNTSRPPEDSGRIALLEYELRQERANLQTLRTEMSSVLAFHNSKAKSNGAKGKDLKVEPASPTEKRIMNYLVKKYLVDQGYHLTAISLSSEVRREAFGGNLFFFFLFWFVEVPRVFLSWSNEGDTL
jgi:hypothetical protein